MTGVLAIWNDCLETAKSDYEDWYQGEHLAERVGIEGFQVGRRYEAILARRRFFTSYEVVTPDVLRSAQYLERLAQPTERTNAIMQGVFSNMCRTVCDRNDVRGQMRGAVALTVAFGPGTSLQQMRTIANRNLIGREMSHVEIWTSAETGAPAKSTEEALRGTDEKIEGCVVFEFLRSDPALLLAENLGRMYPDAEIGVYRLLCSLTEEDLSERPVGI